MSRAGHVHVVGPRPWYAWPSVVTVRDVRARNYWWRSIVTMSDGGDVLSLPLQQQKSGVH